MTIRKEKIVIGLARVMVSPKSGTSIIMCSCPDQLSWTILLHFGESQISNFFAITLGDFHEPPLTKHLVLKACRVIKGSGLWEHNNLLLLGSDYTFIYLLTTNQTVMIQKPSALIQLGYLLFLPRYLVLDSRFWVLVGSGSRVLGSEC